MKSIIPDNTEVLIFNSNRHAAGEVDTIFIKGTITSSIESEDLSQHGSPWYEQIYYVLGEDENVYSGTYKTPIIGRHYFMTVEDYKQRLADMIKLNNGTIKDIQDKNKEYQNMIDSFDKTEFYDNDKKLVKTK